MKQNYHSKIYQDATLALFSSLDIHLGIRALYDVLRQVIPLQTLILKVSDVQTMKVRIIADAGREAGTTDNVTDIPEHLKNEIRWRNIATDTSHVFTRVPPKSMIGILMKKYGYSSDSIYWTPLILDQQHFGGFAALAQKGQQIEADHFAILEVLKKPLAIALANYLLFEQLNDLSAALADDNVRLQNELNDLSGTVTPKITPGLAEVIDNIGRVAGRDTPVLILGETGVGKEVVANSVHGLSSRSNGPFITVNCGAFPENLVDSYLFGHEKGAFTGAEKLRKGYFERADKGTLFLDEIGELPLDVQVKLLRVLETQHMERVGGQDSIHVDVRILAATHRNLVDMVNNGTFREDLWYRLNVYPIIVPPLRKRKSDIRGLVQHFLATKSRELNLHRIPKIHDHDIQLLESYDFPGNIRELQNIIERALIHYHEEDGDYISGLADYISIRKEGSPAPSQMRLTSLDDAIRAHIEKALEACKGKIQGPKGAAALLELPPSTLRAKMKKLNIRKPVVE